MTEKLLHFIWQFGYFNQSVLTTTDGDRLTILSRGALNTNAGPDFSNAKINIGSTTLFGNIELHLKTSDWAKHRHEADSNYRNVILHVVFQHDKNLPHSIPVLELEPRTSTLLCDRYAALMAAEGFVPCSALLPQVNPLVWVAWKDRLMAERLTRKAQFVLALYEESNSHWQETFWWLLARNFGMKVNADAFEAIARSLPLTILAKHKHSIQQVEALLFGQAGLLNDTFTDEYPRMLQREYRYLQKKLALPAAVISLQFLRMRPQSFPTLRLAQLAVLLIQSSHLFSSLLDTEDLDKLLPLFRVKANDYWHYHYTFHQPSAFKEKSLGEESIRNLVLNTMIPVLFAYGEMKKDETCKRKALRWLEELKAEKNKIVQGFQEAGVQAVSAFDSQAFVELKTQYCTQKKCLQCAVGNYLLKTQTNHPTLISDL